MSLPPPTVLAFQLAPFSKSQQSALESTETPSSMHLAIPRWTPENWLVHGFSTRVGGLSRLTSSRGDLSRGDLNGGELNLGYTANDDPATVTTNRRRFLDEVFQGRRARREQTAPGLVTLKQMHSSLTRRVGRTDVGERASLWGDGLITDEPGVLLGIQTADCLPILVADPKRRAVAAFHAGWRGTLKGIVEQGIEAMRKEFGSDPENLTAAIGPGIGGCCFAVGPEVGDLFRAKYPYAPQLFVSQSPLRMDLAEANRRQLLSAGLPHENIHSLGLCTSCAVDRFFSYRAERGKTGRMMAVIGLRLA